METVRIRIGPRVKRNRPTEKTRVFQGLTVNVERPAGTVVPWTASDGTKGETVYAVDYGYFPGVPSVDGDSLDAFVAPNEQAADAYVIQQLKDGKADQPKVMLGCTSAKEARDIFDAHRWPGAYGGCARLTVDNLKEQIGNWSGELLAEPIDEPESTSTNEKFMENTNAKRGFAQLARHVAIAAIAAGTVVDPEVRDALLPFVRGLELDEGNGAPVQRPDGMRVRELHVRAVREDAREVDFVASTEAVDSYGEIVKQNWRLERYLKNPVVLFAHDSHSLPIGRALNVRVEAGALLLTVKFATARANPFAELCFQSVLEGMLRGGSVGFMPHTIRYEKVNDQDRCILDDNELYEFTVCPVPSNPEGLAQLDHRVTRSLETAFTNQPAAARGKEGTVPEFKKKALGDDDMTELRNKGMCKVYCECGAEMGIEMPALAKMDEEAKALSAKNADLEKQVAAERAAAETLKAQVAAETAKTRTIEVRAELAPLVADGKLAEDDVDDYVTLALEKPERYAKKVEKVRERAPRGDSLTNRIDLGAEPTPQKGSTGVPASPDDVLMALGQKALEGTQGHAPITDPDEALLSFA